MGHSTLKLVPGADLNETPVLNEAGVSQTQLIRYFYDRKMGALPQKLGGWTKFYASPLPAIARALWAWEDTQAITHLAYGTEVILTNSQLGVITNGTLKNLTPTQVDEDITAVASSTSGSSIITITDTTTTGITQYDSVYIATHIAIGGIVLFGLYACDPDGFIAPTTYTVQAIDVLGNPVAATSSSTAPVLPMFSTTADNPITLVTLPAHGYSVGSTFPVTIPTVVGGATFYGNYDVIAVTDADNFSITATTTPTSGATGYVNGNQAHLIYNFGFGSIPTGTGYGIGAYGSGGYGTGTAVVPSTGSPISATDWTLDSWGGILLACPINGTTAPPYQPLYFWNPDASAPSAEVIPGAPPVNDGMFVAMPQRQIVAWGSTFTGIQDPLLVRWSDVNNFNTWIGTVINQAGSYRIPKGSKIVGALQGPQQALVWTDLGIWAMQYIGPPYVYSFNEIGSGCGLIARKAMASINGVVYWMGPSQFFSLTANGVAPVPCPIWDVVFQNINTAHLNKIRIAVNSRFGEISWFYPSQNSTENDSYVKYNVTHNTWDFGTLGRTAWIDQSVLGPPIGADPTTLYLYQHETSPDADGQAMASSFRTGWFSIADGDQMTYVDQVWPDMKWGTYSGSPNATINLTFYVTNYPGDTPQVFGPYPVTQTTEYISPRFRGRLVSINVSSDDVGSFWRLGGVRWRSSPDGKF